MGNMIHRANELKNIDGEIIFSLKEDADVSYLLKSAILDGVNLERVRLDHFFLNHFKELKEGCSIKGASLVGVCAIGIHLRGLDCKGIYAKNAIFRYGNGEGSDFRGAFFTGERLDLYNFKIDKNTNIRPPKRFNLPYENSYT